MAVIGALDCCIISIMTCRSAEAGAKGPLPWTFKYNQNRLGEGQLIVTGLWKTRQPKCAALSVRPVEMPRRSPDSHLVGAAEPHIGHEIVHLALHLCKG